MGDTFIYPFIELVMLLLFCKGMRRRHIPLKSGIVIAGMSLIYMLSRYFLIAQYDSAILILRVLYLTILCYVIYDTLWENSAFLSACLSLFLHTIIVFYYNIPFLSGFTKQWPIGDFFFINLLRAILVIALSGTVAEMAQSRIDLTAYLLVGVSYFGYFFDIRGYMAVTSGQVSPLESTIILFMYCLATTLAVIAAMWYIASQNRRENIQMLEETIKKQYLIWDQKTERDAAISRMYHDVKKQISLIKNGSSALMVGLI